MNRTIKDATVKRYHYESHDQLVRHLADFVAAYNFARRLKTLGGLAPYEFVCSLPEGCRLMGIARSTPAQRRQAHDDLIRGTPIPSGRGKAENWRRFLSGDKALPATRRHPTGKLAGF